MNPLLLETESATSGLARRWFTRMYGMAIVAHVVGNPPLGFDLAGMVSVLTGAGALALVLDPRTAWLRPVVAGGVVWMVWLEAPLLANHWLVMGFVSLALLVATTRPDPWAWFAPVGRLILLVFYGFAAFAKLNEGFFDPTVSCGVHYANQSLGSWGLPTVPVGGAMALAVAVAAAAVELAVPILLVVPRTRRLGVVLGFAFHFVISLDRGQHFFDFTAVLMMLFALFLPDRDLAAAERVAVRHRRWVLAVVATSAVLVGAAAAPPTQPSLWLVRQGVFWVWIPAGALLVAWALRHVRGEDDDVSVRPPGVVAFALVALVFVNGLTPYLELKTAYGFNMYANLVTVAGASNHFLVRATLPLSDEHEDLVEVVSTDDPALRAYVDSGWALVRSRVLDHLADHPDAEVTVRPPGSEVTEVLRGSEAGRPLPVLVEKFLLFRAVDLRDPPRCQTAWLPVF